MSKIITHEMFVQMVNDNNPYVEVIGRYSKMREKILCRCKICNEEYYAAAYDVKSGKKHHLCAPKIAYHHNKTHDEFIKQMNEINPDIEILGEYIAAKSKLMCRCKKHDVTYYAAPTNLLRGQGCVECGSEKIIQKLSKTHEDFVKEAKNKNGKLTILGTYINCKTKVLTKCNDCGFEWDNDPSMILAGYGCPKCVGRYKSTEEFRNEIKSINPSIKIIGEYIDSKTKIECQCLKCGWKWKAKPQNLHYTGCPTCNMSHGEKRISNWLRDNMIPFIPQMVFEGLKGVGGGRLPFDFYFPTYNLLLEYQGEFHDGNIKNDFQSPEQLSVQKEHDKRKKIWADSNNIELFEIWYYDFDRIEEILTEKFALNKNPVEITVA